MTISIRWARAVSAIRRITGMPDYSVYLAHHRANHCDQPPLSERDYFEQFLEQRYSGVSRCC